MFIGGCAAIHEEAISGIVTPSPILRQATATAMHLRIISRLGAWTGATEGVAVRLRSRRTVELIKQVAGNTTGTELSVCCPGPSNIAI
jgi:hypothetical protein